MTTTHAALPGANPTLDAGGRATPACTPGREGPCWLGRLDRAVLACAVVMVPVAISLTAWYAPIAQPEIGAIAQKIFYVHVPCALTGFLAFTIGLAAGIGYLRTRRAAWDALGASAIEVGMLFATLVVCTGPLWARPVWGSYWNLEPRLMSFTVMWFTYAGYLILRGALDGTERRAAVCAAYAIIASINVPIVYLSVQLVRPEGQLHPIQAEITPKMRIVLYAGFAAFGSLMLALVAIRYRLERARLRLGRSS